mmetsp:Transcript_55040/g.131576  ORF Transcript_55040/g.131576 Transcript_55040/m.131576 type:complete len:355 (-) Transcript_55040:47-1111(-)
MRGSHRSLGLLGHALHDCWRWWRWRTLSHVPHAGRAVPRGASDDILLKEAQVDAQCKLRVLIEVLDHLAHCHVEDIHSRVIGARHNLCFIERMALHSLHRQLMAMQNLERLPEIPQVESSDGLIHAPCHHHELVVFVPVHGENLMLMSLNALHRPLACAEILDVQHRVPAHGGQRRRPGRRPNRCIGQLLMRPERAKADATHGIPDLYAVVPGGGGDEVLLIKVPVHPVDLCGVLLQRHDGPRGIRPVEELQSAICLTREEHVLVGLTPRHIIDRLVGEPLAHRWSTWSRDVQDVQLAVAHDAEVLASADGQQVPAEGRELTAVAAEGHPEPAHGLRLLFPLSASSGDRIRHAV